MSIVEPPSQTASDRCEQPDQTAAIRGARLSELETPLPRLGLCTGRLERRRFYGLFRAHLEGARAERGGSCSPKGGDSPDLEGWAIWPTRSNALIFRRLVASPGRISAAPSLGRSRLAARSGSRPHRLRRRRVADCARQLLGQRGAQAAGAEPHRPQLRSAAGRRRRNLRLRPGADPGYVARPPWRILRAFRTLPTNVGSVLSHTPSAREAGLSIAQGA